MKIIVILLAGLFVFSCFYQGSAQANDVQTILNMEISDVDLSSVPDGEFIGEVPFRKYMYRVKVTVKSGKITDIEVLENGTCNKYAQKGLAVVPRMLEKQSPRVDAITGATVTSKALMKAVEQALASASASKK